MFCEFVIGLCEIQKDLSVPLSGGDTFCPERGGEKREVEKNLHFRSFFATFASY
jgi:hypothetical protein